MIFRYRTDDAAQRPAALPGPGASAFAGALARYVVAGNPDKPWAVARLAHEVGRSRFAAIVMEHVGVPPLAYLTRVRNRSGL